MDITHQRNVSGGSSNSTETTFKSELPPLPCIRAQLATSLDTPFVLCSTLFLVTINMFMVMLSILLAVLGSREVIPWSADMDEINNVLVSFCIFFTTMFALEILFRILMLGSRFFIDPVNFVDLIVVVVSLSLQGYYTSKGDKTLGMIAASLNTLRIWRIVNQSNAKSTCELIKSKENRAEKAPSQHLQMTMLQLRGVEKERDELRVTIKNQADHIRQLTTMIENLKRNSSDGRPLPSTTANKYSDPATILTAYSE